MTIAEILAQELNQKLEYIENIITLMDEGNTIPFIARYRKEMHGAMDDTTLRTLETRLTYLRNLQERQEEVKRSIENQGKLTEELSAAIDAAATMTEVEDLYRPYKQKRRTRGSMAREKGLAPLAEAIFAQDGQDPAKLAESFIDPEKGVNTIEEALQGANDIIAEDLSDDADIRKALRDLVMRKGTFVCKASENAEENGVYKLYYDFSQPVSRLLDHQILAINRGEKEEVLKANVTLVGNDGYAVVRRAALKPVMTVSAFVRDAADDAYDRLIFPSIQREVRNELSDRAYAGAIHNFALNLKPLLMQPPVKGFVTMGLDPGYRNGCKVVSACFTSVASSCFSCVLCSTLLSFCNTSANSEAARLCLYESLSGATHNRCHWDGLTLLGCSFLPSIVAAHRHSPDLARNTATRWMRFKSTSCSLPPKMSTFRSGFASAIA